MKKGMHFNSKYMNLPSLIFNLIETLLLIGMAYYLKIGLRNTLIIFLTFQISRAIFKLPKHYKAWQKCLIWTLLIFTSLFVVSRVDITVGVMCAVFTAYILSGKSDIKNMYMWSGTTSKYDALRDFVGISPNNPIILDYEEYWRKNNPIRYEMFKYFYRERKSYQEIRNLKNYDENNIIKNECKSIYEQLEVPLNLPPLKR